MMAKTMAARKCEPGEIVMVSFTALLLSLLDAYFKPMLRCRHVKHIMEPSESLLREEPSLSLGDFHGSAAFLVVIRYMIDPCAHGKGLHITPS